jgi:hypothetical protein
MTKIVFHTYKISETGYQFLDSEPLPSLVLPSARVTRHPCESETGEVCPASVKSTRKSKGTHLLPVLTSLLSSRENWYEIKDHNDYQYPGKFRLDHPHRLGFAPDITTLPLYTKEDEHFLFTDIQLSKGKPRAARKITVHVDNKEEELFYRIAPCGGVKCCSAEGCSFTICNRDRRPCPKHPESSLVASGACPVEFVYVWPACNDDKRRWHSGIVRRDDMKDNDLHNHPLPSATKVPAKSHRTSNMLCSWTQLCTPMT